MAKLIHIKKGTHPASAFRNSSQILWDYFLDNSKDHKLKTGIRINITLLGDEQE